MNDAIIEFFEGDKQLPGRGKGKAQLAERMAGLGPEELGLLHFSTAWGQRKDNKFRLAK
jgi:hypothetical protein